MDATRVQAQFERAAREIGKVFVGQDALVEAVLIALFCEGNVLIEGVPGLGKTLLVNALGRVVSCRFRRIQFTPDLMPSDITGSSVYDMKDREFTFNRGPIFTNLLLADEINRAPAKTQSALLEAMQERQVTVDGTTYLLERPFLTIATQNPLEQEGTYPLPEAQLDRFMFKLLIDYPPLEHEKGILAQYAQGKDNRDLNEFGLEAVLQAPEVLQYQRDIRQVIVEPSIIAYITAIVAKTRSWHTIDVGASPRASVNILLASRGMAACRGRNFVVPDDVKELAVWVLRHRLRLRPDAEIEGIRADDVVREVLESVEGASPMTPRLTLLLVLGLAGLPLVAGIWLPGAGPLGAFLTVAVVVAALADLAISPSPARVEVRREVGDVLSVGARNPVKIWLRNRGPSNFSVEVHDEPPAPCTLYDLPFRISLKPGAQRYAVYHCEPHVRGRNQFGVVFVRSVSRLSFWELYAEHKLEHPVRVYPDIKAVYGVELLARQNRLAEAGVKLSRLRGRGNEFERLREYRREDEYRDIDWKATARHQSLISREYVVERNQNVLFLLDCGRSMCNEHEGITHFDRALNAAILLSYVALRQGDTVGILACSNRVERWVRPVRGTGGAGTLIRHTYDLQPSYAASDYALMVEELRRCYRKRSLVVLLTHALDEVHMGVISRNARELRSPHLLLAAFLRNVPLHERVNAIPQNDLEAFQIAAAAEMSATQSLEAARLEKSGVLVIDALPEQLSAGLISRYLDIKARHLL